LIRLLPLVLVFVLVLVPALVAAAPEAGLRLSLADATARALQKNHDIAFERDNFRIATASLLKADGSYDPTFHLDARYRDHRDPVNSLLSGAPPGELAPQSQGVSGAASLSQLLPTGGSVSLSTSVSRDRTNNFLAILSPAYSTSFGIDVRQPLLQNLSIDPARRTIRVAKIDRDRGAASLRRTVTDTVTLVERAYWNLVAARRDVLVRESSVTLADEQRSDSETKIEVGTLPESDIAQPEAELERRRGDLYAARETAKRAELLLKTLILNDEADPVWTQTILPLDEPETAIQSVDVAAALRDAASRRPELKDASLKVDRQDIDIAVARDRIRPQLDLVASYTSRGLAGSLNPYAPATGFLGGPVSVPEPLDGGLSRSLGTTFENRFPDASIGLSLTVPIFNRSARGDLAIANAVRSQAATTLAQLRQRVAVEVRNAALTLETAAQRIDAGRAGRKAAETQLRAEKERFAVGLSTNFFVLTRQNDLAQAVLTETAALTDYRKAQTDFSRAVGTLLDERRIEIKDDAPAVVAAGGSR
jgi:outer membrane protein TolC